MVRIILVIVILLAPAGLAVAAGEPESADRVRIGNAPLFGREQMRSFVLANFDRFASTKLSLPALSRDQINFVSHSFQPKEVTFILESFSGLFPGVRDETSDNKIEIFHADHLSAEVADQIMAKRPDVGTLIRREIDRGTLCWSGRLPTSQRDIPIVLVSERVSPQDLSKCLYRSVMAQMGVVILYKDRYATEGQLNAILSHMANITAMHIFFECRQHIRSTDFPRARSCVEQRLDELY